MSTKTATPTIESLQAQVVKLERANADLVDAKLELEDQLAGIREDEQDAERAHERAADRLQQIVVDHHDEARHRGSVRFCTEAPCPALNTLLDDGDLR